jgi:hypothetical protein
MDGLYMVRSFMSGTPVAGRIRLFRLADVPSNALETDRLYQAICDRSGELSRTNLAAQLPDNIAALLLGELDRGKAVRPNVMPADLTDSMTTLAMALDILADGAIRRRQVMDAVRSLYADVLPTG